MPQNRKSLENKFRLEIPKLLKNACSIQDVLSIKNTCWGMKKSKKLNKKAMGGKQDFTHNHAGWVLLIICVKISSFCEWQIMHAFTSKSFKNMVPWLVGVQTVDKINKAFKTMGSQHAVSVFIHYLFFFPTVWVWLVRVNKGSV